MASILESGLRTVYVYENSKGAWCYRYKEDVHGNLYLTLTCRALFDKGFILPEWNCHDSDAVSHELEKGCSLSCVKAVPCKFVLRSIKSLVKEK
ncbi:hypothetical protein VPH5P1C_0251 [Vibrio phage 5P1c]|nr:hypothetical protein VP495E541_P0257 [Vibrio phage 495E54-1]